MWCIWVFEEFWVTQNLGQSMLVTTPYCQWLLPLTNYGDQFQQWTLFILKQYCLEGILAKESSPRTKDFLLWRDLLTDRMLNVKLILVIDVGLMALQVSPTNLHVGKATGRYAGHTSQQMCRTRDEPQECISCMPLLSENKAAHSGFETQRRHQQKSETGVSVTPKMDMCPLFFLISPTDLFKFKGKYSSLFGGPLIPLFLMFALGFKARMDPSLAGLGVCMQLIPLVQHLLTPWWPAWQPSLFDSHTCTCGGTGNRECAAQYNEDLNKTTLCYLLYNYCSAFCALLAMNEKKF